MTGSNKQLVNQKPPKWMTGPNHTHQLPLVDNEIILNDGEMICDACDGTGWDKEFTLWGGRKICHKCQGERKLDWVSKITGVPEKEYTGIDSSSSVSLNTASTLSIDKNILIDDKPIETYIKDIVAQKLAEKFDEQITEAIAKHTEQNNKKRRNFFDNRIFSKLMFFCNFK